jgi:hypothetical protein
MGGVNNIQFEGKKMHSASLWGNLLERNHFEVLGPYGWINIKWILKK